MAKKVTLTKYKVSVPLLTHAEFYVLTDSKENAIKFAKESSPSLNWDENNNYCTIDDYLFMSDDWHEDVIPHYETHFKSQELPTGFKYDYARIGSPFDHFDFKNATAEENGSLTEYIPETED